MDINTKIIDKKRQYQSGECFICGGVAKRRNKVKLLDLITTNTWECLNCGVFFRHPLPDVESVKKYYSTRYFRYSDKTESNLAKAQATWIDRAFKKSDLILAALDYIEFGAGRGWLVSEMKSLAKSSIGFETDEISVRWGLEKLGADLRSGFITEINKLDIQLNNLSLFSLSHVLEHLHHPKELLEALALKYRGSYIFLEVPDGKHESATMVLDDYSQSSMGQHFWSFTEHSLRILLPAAGWEVLELGSFGSSRFYESNHTVLKIKKHLRHKFNSLNEEHVSMKKWTIELCQMLSKIFLAGLKITINRILWGYRYSRENMPVIRVCARANGVR